jgi:hypothetical protein
MGGYLLRDGFMAAPKLAPFFWTKPGIASEGHAKPREELEVAMGGSLP